MLNDWVFYDAKLHQVASFHQGRIWGVKDGMFSTSGDLHDKCFPLNLTNKYWSDIFAALLDKMPYNNNVNIPRIKGKIVSCWIDAMNCSDDTEKNRFNL